MTESELREAAIKAMATLFEVARAEGILYTKAPQLYHDDAEQAIDVPELTAYFEAKFKAEHQPIAVAELIAEFEQIEDSYRAHCEVEAKILRQIINRLKPLDLRPDPPKQVPLPEALTKFIDSLKERSAEHLRVSRIAITEHHNEMWSRVQEAISDTLGQAARDLEHLTFAPETQTANQLRQALQDDASDLWKVTNAIKKVIQSYDWITEGRGAYAYDDERYRQETKNAFDAVLQLIEGVQHPAQLRFHKVMDATRNSVTSEITDEMVEKTANWLEGTAKAAVDHINDEMQPNGFHMSARWLLKSLGFQEKE